jgi:signal transduction histidine kinase/CheY-like chemotaxis protein
MDIVYSPYVDADNKIQGFIVNARDITEQKRAEEARQQIEEQLRHAQKMEAVGQLAAGVAHDFNNQLVGIIGNAQLLLAGLAEKLPDRERVALQDIGECGERAAALIRQLLAFSRKRSASTRSLDLSQAVADAGRMLRSMIGENISLEIVPGEGIWPIKADATEIEQIVMNLVVNARDAMPNGGNVRIGTANVILDEAYAALNPEARPGPHVILSVADTGCGMSDETMNRVFEPFFTTKPVGKGTGLGLSTVYGIVGKSNGHIKVDSEVGEGTAFHICFPRAEDAAMASDSEGRQVEGAEPTGDTVLLCEDNDAVRRLTQQVLEGAGYRVLAGTGPMHALTLASQHGGAIPLLLTDVVMPEMNGRELADKLCGQLGELKVLYMSGYSHDVMTSYDVGDGDVEFIEKPFLPQDLLRRVRRILQGGEVPTQ